MTSQVIYNILERCLFYVDSKNITYPIDRYDGEVYNLYCCDSGDPVGRKYKITMIKNNDFKSMDTNGLNLYCHIFYKKVAFDMKRAEKRIRRRRKHNIKKILDIILFNDISYDIIKYI
jgi:hypothetical protein